MVGSDVRDAQILLISATNRMLDAAEEMKRERDRIFGLLRSRQTDSPDVTGDAGHHA